MWVDLQPELDELLEEASRPVVRRSHIRIPILSVERQARRGELSSYIRAKRRPMQPLATLPRAVCCTACRADFIHARALEHHHRLGCKAALKGEQTVTEGIRILDVIDLVAEQCRLRRADLIGRSRIGRIARARHWAMRIARDEGWSFPKIGAAFNRDHTSVMHACGATAQRVVRKDHPDYWPVWDAWQARKALLLKPVREIVPVRYRVAVEPEERVA